MIKREGEVRGSTPNCNFDTFACAHIHVRRIAREVDYGVVGADEDGVNVRNWPVLHRKEQRQDSCHRVVAVIKH